MKTQAQRKRAADSEYQVNRKERLLLARGMCERCGVRRAEQTHHVIRRRAGGGAVNHEVANLRAVCAFCHIDIHTHVKDSKASGWIVSEWPRIEVRDD